MHVVSHVYCCMLISPSPFADMRMSSLRFSLLSLSLQATQEIVTLVPQATASEMSLAASSAQEAFASWRLTPISVRQRVFLRLQALVHENEARIVEAIVKENGKTVTDAKGDVFRGLEVRNTKS